MIRSIFSPFISSSPEKAPRRQAKRLGSELLERRELMTVTPHGGVVIPNVETQAVYLGQQWTAANPTNYNLTGRIDNSLKSIVNSSYMDMLQNAGYGVGRGTDSPGVIDGVSIDKNRFLTDATIQSDLQSYISRGYLQQPNYDRLYVVYVEPGVAIQAGNVTSQSGFLGYHESFAGRDYYGRSTQIRYDVIAYPGGWNPTSISQGFRTDFDDLTEVTSHELAESVSIAD